MEKTEVFSVIVTQVKISMPFIKMFAKNILSEHLVALKQLKDHFNRTSEVHLGVGEVCIARVSSGSDGFERCRIMKVNGAEKTASLSFIDAGYQGILPLYKIRILNDAKLKNLPAVGAEVILGKVHIVSNQDYKEKLIRLHDMIVGAKCEMAILGENEAGRFVDFRFSDASLINDVIPNDKVLRPLLQYLSLGKQMRMIMEKTRQKELVEPDDSFRPETFVESPDSKKSEKKLCSNDSPFPGTYHEVRISEFDEGPCSFFVHIVASDAEYQKFQVDLQSNKDDLYQLKSPPPVGSTCLALIEDQLFRVLIVHSPETSRSQVKVQQLETGSSMIIEKNRLFRMPRSIASIPSFAKQFKLAGINRGSIANLKPHEASFYFQHITQHKILNLEIVSSEGAIPLCHLFDQAGRNIFEECQKWDPHCLKFPQQKPLKDNAHKVVIISAESPKQFHVHIMDHRQHAKYIELNHLLEMFQSPVLRSPKIDDSCVVLMDGLKVRGRIIRSLTADIFKVFAVDIGYEEDYHENEINLIVKDYLKVPPLAFKCCLSGFENDDEQMSAEICNNFTEVCKRINEFQMRIVERKEDCYIVELEDLSCGSKIINQLRGDLKSYDWPTPQSTKSAHFQRQRAKHAINNSVLSTYAVSPDDTKASSTPFSSPDREAAEESGSKDVSELIWSDTSSLGNKGPKTLDASGPSSLVRPSPNSTSGVSSGFADSSNSDREEARITAIVNPMDFTLQKQCDIVEYNAFSDRLQTLAKSQSPMTAFAEGSMCLAFNSFTKMWCRAIIIDADTKEFLITVRCVDDGTTFSIQEKSKLKVSAINIIFLKQYFGHKCSLPISLNMKRESESIALLQKIMMKNLSFFHLGSHLGVHFIELYCDGENVTDDLVKKGYALRMFIAANGPAYINYVNSAHDFSIQMQRDTTALNNIMRYAEAYERIEVDDPKVGMLVIGFSQNDMFWYRSKILSIKKGEFEVYFIDQGHSAVVKLIGSISNPSIAAIHPLAIKCTLRMKNLGQEADDILKKLAQNGHQQVQVEMVQPGAEAAVVKIMIGTDDILIKLLAPYAQLHGASSMKTQALINFVNNK